MSKYRNALPQLDGGLFLTDSGLETYLVFQEGVALPEFAAFPLLDSPVGRRHIVDYLKRHAKIALDAQARLYSGCADMACKSRLGAAARL